MNRTSTPQRDPLGWCTAIALIFMMIAGYGLLVPSGMYFDEIHYVPAARHLLRLVAANREHPLLGKEIIAASIALLGDRPLAWRLPSLLFGGVGLFAFGRMTWWISKRRFATFAAMLLLAGNLMWFIQSRIAMLDMFAASLLMVALWQFAAAIAPDARRVRLRLALSGACLGLALGAKWSVLPYAPLPGLAFGILWLSRRRPRSAAALVEAALLLGLLPLLVYWATYAPALFYTVPGARITPFGFIEQHRQMFALQESVVRPHQYQSVWYQWVADWRPIWYLYRHVDGVQRGVLLLGNPFTMLAGLIAALWCGWIAWRRRRADALAFTALYLVGVGFWIVAEKPVQFYYHYLLPGAFLCGCLALMLDALHSKGGRWRWPPVLAVAMSLALFAWFYPIISATPLTEGKISYQRWMWLDSWR